MTSTILREKSGAGVPHAQPAPCFGGAGMKKTLVTGLAAVSSAFAVSAFAIEVVHTGDDAESGAALVAAAKGITDMRQTIEVGPGRYLLPESVPLMKYGTRLVGTGANRSAILDGGGVVRCVESSNGLNAEICNLTLSNGVVRSAASASGGGCNWLSSISNCTITCCGLIGESATGEYYGGGVFRGTVRDSLIANCFVSNTCASCTGSNSGGGFYSNSGAYSTVFSNCCVRASFDNDSTAGNTICGGGVGSATAVTDCRFYFCSAINTHPSRTLGARAGAAAANVTRCLFVGNTATGRGVAVDNAKVADCTFIGNYGTGKSGPIAYGSYNATITGSLFQDNQLEDGNATSGNSACVDGFANLLDCAFVGNKSSGATGVAIGRYGDCTVSNCVFIGNSGYQPAIAAWATYIVGGIVYLSQGSARVLDCLFAHNSDTGCLQTIHMPSAYESVVRNCLVCSNRNSGVIHASAWESGLLPSYRWICTIEGCTIAGNTISNNCNAVNFGRVNSGEQYIPGMTNTVVVDNISADGKSYKAVNYLATAAEKTGYCFLDSRVADSESYRQAATEVLTGDNAGFVDSTTGNFRPGRNSPLRNAGATLPWMTDGAKDFGDMSYVVNPDGAGIKIVRNNRHPRVEDGLVDIGAYEYWQSPGLMLLLK